MVACVFLLDEMGAFEIWSFHVNTGVMRVYMVCEVSILNNATTYNITTSEASQKSKNSAINKIHCAKTLLAKNGEYEHDQ
jgi:hypothetical protein